MNLHTHLEGWVRPATARELASSTGVAEPPEGWEAALRMPEKGDLTQFLSHVAAAYPVLGSYSGLARVTREAVEDACADGTVFLELRAGPTTHVRDNFPLDGVVSAMCEGLADGVASTGMPAVLVLAMLREFDEDAAMQVVEVAVRFRSHGVAAVDLAGDEKRFPDIAPFVRAFATAQEAGLGATAHAAEGGPATAARDAHELLGVNRIGHGSQVALDPDELLWAAEANLCFEVCPTSNVLTGAVPGIRSHPLKPMVAAGLRVVLGDDDPVTTGTPLSEERRVVLDEMDLDPAHLMAMSEAALDVAFCDDGTRQTLRSLSDT